MPVDAAADHALRLAPVQGWLRGWLLVGATVAALILGVGRRTFLVNLEDAMVPLHDLERKLPDDAARRELSERLLVERTRAREGTIELETYRSLRQKLAALAPAPTLSDVDRALIEADPGGRPLEQQH